MKKRIIFAVLAFIIIACIYFGWQIFGPTINDPEKKYFYVHTNATYQQVIKGLKEAKIIEGEFWFNLVAKKAGYPIKVKAGRYQIKSGSSIFSLVRMLRSGNQSPVNLVINKLRTKEDFAAKIANNFECDSQSVILFLNNIDSLKKYKVDSNTVMTVVIPDTYSILWNTTPSKIFKKLFTAQQKFWDKGRQQKAAAINMTPQQIYTMASIVEEETNMEEDKGKIASAYINRLKQGQRLEADPTIKFALRDFGLKRIRNSHKNAAASSPYNTYFKSGLPPGPICTPSPNTIDAVLNAPGTNYLFFVARPDWSGLSNFTNSYQEHISNAKKYQHFLDSVNIK